ncbi:hypothetical protein [Acinetobacter baumannii]|uniref:hypothetical protein n=1 Tax=Acinetobacter baumannii TaxID=470 RepID=UPI001EEC6EAC|nr:hypothetical protein [Acinetobacter baumannii]
MTDLNKEREAFERLPLAELAIKSEFVYYNEETNSYWPNEDFCPSDAPETMNFAWEAWQEKAKAQAVPVWISADFMKPDEGNLVLGISTTKLAKFNVYQVVALDEFDECEINYWMPLPTAPSESGAEQ